MSVSIEEDLQNVQQKTEAAQSGHRMSSDARLCLFKLSRKENKISSR